VFQFGIKKQFLKSQASFNNELKGATNSIEIVKGTGKALLAAPGDKEEFFFFFKYKK
jgi:hypothetical protein